MSEQGLGVLIFNDHSKEEEWKSLDPAVKKAVVGRLAESCSMMTTNIAIETLAHAINDLAKRVDKLEGWTRE